MTVTVIIPTYNRADMLRNSLISIFKQTRPTDQVIVVNDGSTDHTKAVIEEIFREFAPTQPPATLFVAQDGNKGKSRAVNLGLTRATGDLVWIFDDDDVADPRRLEDLVPLFEQDPDLDVVHTDARWIYPERRRERHWVAEAVPDNYQLARMMCGNFWFGISVMWKRRILRRLAALEAPYMTTPWPKSLGADPVFDPDHWPFDPELERAQDYDFFIRLAWAGAKVRAFHGETVIAIEHQGGRGIGHKIAYGQIRYRTALCETKIFQKVHQRISLEWIWPGADPKKADGIYEAALIERAVHLFRRSLLAECAGDLALIRHPNRIYGEHRKAVHVLQQWVSSLESNVSVANVETLDGKAIPEHLQGQPVQNTVREIREHVAAIRIEIDRLMQAWEISDEERAAARAAGAFLN